MAITFTPVPEERWADIRQPGRAAWFNALLEHGMLQMSARPTLTAAQKRTLDEQGARMRSRVLDEAIYVWLEDDDVEGEHADDEEAPIPDDDLPI